MENPDHNIEFGSNPKRTRIEVDVANLPTNPGLRIKISNYHPNERDQIRRHYLQNKPCQLVTMIFHKINLAKQSVDLIYCGSKNILVGWNMIGQECIDPL